MNVTSSRSSPAYKHKGFYLLVTDEGYRSERNLVWEQLAQVPKQARRLARPVLASVSRELPSVAHFHRTFPSSQVDGDTLFLTGDFQQYTAVSDHLATAGPDGGEEARC